MAIIQSLARVGPWFWENLGTISTIVGLLSPFAGWLLQRWNARRQVEDAVGYSLEIFVDSAMQGDHDLHIVRCFLRAGIRANHRDTTGRTALVEAARAGQVRTVRLLVTKRWCISKRWADPNRTDRDGLSPVTIAVARRFREIYDILVDAGAVTDPALRAAVLRQAVEDGDVAEVSVRSRALLAGEIDIPGVDGRNALLIAVEHAHPAIVRHLLDANADPNARHQESAALLIAARQGLGVIAEEIAMRPRTDVDAAGPFGETALILAAEGGYLGIVRALLGRNANAAAADRRGRTALMAAILGDYKTIADLLRERTNAGEADAWLILAAELGDENKVRELLDAGANPNAQGAGGRSALLDAARHGHVAVGRLLIESRRANVNITDDGGNTALMLAVQTRSREFVAMLQLVGADARARRSDGSTVMMDAATSGHTGVLNEILKTEPALEEIDAAREDGVTPLMAAVETGERSIVDRLLDAGANPNVQTNEGVSPLMIAVTRGDRAMTQLLRDRGAVLGDNQGQLLVEARRGNLPRVQQLLDAGVSANLVGPRGSAPLLEAVQGGHFDVAAELIRRGADVDHEGGGRTALGLAVRGGHFEIVKMLLERGARVDTRLSGGRTPLLIQCEKYSSAILDALLDAGADVDASDDLGRTPLLIALVSGRKDLEQKLRDKNATKGELEARLILAARGGNLEEVKGILGQRPNVDTPGPGGETALVAASEHAEADVVDALLSVGANVNVKASSGTPLTVAARRGNLSVLDTLLAAGARADLTGPDDRTPLMIAAARGHLEIVRHLLDAKNNPNERDRSGCTALMLAAEGGHEEVLSELFAASATVDARGPGGRTALMFAAAAGELGTLQLLIAKGADVNARDDDGSTVLILACLGEQLSAVTELLTREVDVDARDAFGQTSLMLAILAKNETLETKLRKKGASIGESEAKLIDSAARGIPAPVRMLLNAGVEVNARRRGDDTALIASIANGHSHIARMLLDHGADVNIKGRGGRTALIAAAMHGDLALIRALTAHEARMTCEAMDENGMNAVLATQDPNIRLHLQQACGALQPDDTVYVTNKGRCYHTDNCGSLHGGGRPWVLIDAANDHLRPCSTCITNQ